MKSCNQIFTPEVDNTLQKCNDFIPSDCVIIEKICSKVDNKEGESLSQFIERLCLKLSKMDNEISYLKKRLANVQEM